MSARPNWLEQRKSLPQNTPLLANSNMVAKTREAEDGGGSVIQKKETNSWCHTTYHHVVTISQTIAVTPHRLPTSGAQNQHPSECSPSCEAWTPLVASPETVPWEQEPQRGWPGGFSQHCRLLTPQAILGLLLQRWPYYQVCRVLSSEFQKVWDWFVNTSCSSRM